MNETPMSPEIEQQIRKQQLINDHCVKLLEAFNEYPTDYVICVLQLAVATSLIEYGGKETPDGKFDWSIIEAIDNSRRFQENVDALMKMHYQSNDGRVILTDVA